MSENKIEKTPMELDKVYVISNLGIHKMDSYEFCSWYKNTSDDRKERELDFRVYIVFYNNMRFEDNEAYHYLNVKSEALK
jgi:hypothetical protein